VVRRMGCTAEYLERPISNVPFTGHSFGMKHKSPCHTISSTPAHTLRLLPFLATGCGVLGLLAGCASEPDSHVVSAPPPPAPTRTMTTTTTTTTPVAVVVQNPGYVTTATPAVMSTTVVTQAPPALQQEVVLAQPTSQHRWLAGYWTWRNDRYEWMAGHWELPPSSGSVWVTPRWEQQGNAYRFYEGYWN
jgi:hypothetical protein